MLIAPFWEGRSADALTARFSEEERERLLRRAQQTAGPMPSPYCSSRREGKAVMVRHYPPERLAAGREYGRRHGASVNDVAAAAYLLAMAASAGQYNAPLPLTCSVDLRRYLTGAGVAVPAVANLSSSGTLVCHCRLVRHPRRPHRSGLHRAART